MMRIFPKKMHWYIYSLGCNWHDWWEVNIGSSNGLVLPGTKLLPEPMLTQNRVQQVNKSITGEQLKETRKVSPKHTMKSIAHYNIIKFFKIITTGTPYLTHEDMIYMGSFASWRFDLYLTLKFVVVMLYAISDHVMSYHVIQRETMIVWVTYPFPNEYPTFLVHLVFKEKTANITFSKALQSFQCAVLISLTTRQIWGIW